MEEWEWEMEIQEKNFFLKNKGIGISKDDYNTKRSKRHDFQLSTQKKEMGIIKLQFYPSSKIYLGDLFWEFTNASYEKLYYSHCMISIAMTEKCKKTL